jgi:hypothetical protein
MTLSNATFSDIGSSVSDIFDGIGADQQGALQAEGLQIQAQGTRISSQATDITAQGLQTQAQGNIAEATTYNEAAGLATENEAYIAQSTRIQESQAARQETQTIGSQKAAEAVAGFSSGGTAFYVIKESANLGALAQGGIGTQGAITEAGPRLPELTSGLLRVVAGALLRQRQRRDLIVHLVREVQGFLQGRTFLKVKPQ